ncbi:MAG: CotH kinase family protein [Oscillospiraceae bacterium]
MRILIKVLVCAGAVLLTSACGLGGADSVTVFDVSKASQEDASDAGSKDVASPERPAAKQVTKVKPVKLLEQPAEPIADSTLPRVDIVTDDADYTLGMEAYTDATVSVSNAAGNDVTAQAAGVRLRGNSTAEPWKKPLRIKFDQQVSMFGRNAERSWTLLANSYDKTLLHNVIAYDLYAYLSPAGTFSSVCVPVDVYVNGGYQGVYTLCDQIETGSGRVDINPVPATDPAQTDFLIEQDYRAYYTGGDTGDEGEGWFWMNTVNECFAVKSPDPDGGDNAAQTAYIKDFMDQTYAVILTKNWDEIQARIDVDSFINGFMAAEIIKSQDISQSSAYFYKTAGGKLKFGPLWDCDLSMGCGDTGAADADFVAEKNFLFAALMDVPEFRAQYTTRFAAVREDVLAHMLAKITALIDADGASFTNDYHNWERNFNWCSDEVKALGSYNEQVAYMKSWLEKRMNWLAQEYAARG